MVGKLKGLKASFAIGLVISALSIQEASARTYIVNGLASAIPFIGYGMNNLAKRIPGSKVFSYITSIEGNRIIKPNILADIEARFRQNPNEPINLIGISYGANMVAEIASRLTKKGIPVNYLATIEGGSMSTIKPNVRRAHNFTCTGLDCSKRKVRLSAGNSVTQLRQYSFKDGHIDLGNNSQVHRHILGGIR